MVFVCVCERVGGFVNKRETPDWNDLKLGMVVVLNTLPKPIDFGIKRSGRVHG